jgi:NifU-like protein involved in Fe-S cluster formation
LVTELIKGKTLEGCVDISNRDIARYLRLPPVKLHCSMLAENAIKSAIIDYEMKNKKFK